MDHQELNALKKDVSLKARNGIDFIISAAIIWIGITFVWTLDTTDYKRSVLTFIVGGLMLPLAAGLSKLLKTQWKVENNPLQALGLWLNFAQLFYFPFLILALLKFPEYFIFAYAVITGAHLFPYAWFYNIRAYAVIAGVSSFGSLTLTLGLGAGNSHWIGGFMALNLAVLAVILRRSANA